MFNFKKPKRLLKEIPLQKISILHLIVKDAALIQSNHHKGKYNNIP